jgi:Amt family ammonium transporter
VANDGLFYGGGLKQLGIQALGVTTVAIFVVIVMGLVFKLINVTIGLRANIEEELTGLDTSEHGMESYAGFQIR